MKNLSICIVGGSITGCAVAIQAHRAGFRPQVFERSASKLEDRGAGIGVPSATCQSLLADDLIDKTIPHLHVRALAHSSRTQSGDPMGRCAGEIPTYLEALRWGDLYNNLRKRVPNECYSQGAVVQSVADEGHAATVTFASGDRKTFDLVAFADGAQSMGRRPVCPDDALAYRDYVIWRGIIAETDIRDRAPFEGTLQRIGFDGGHFFAYLVPGGNGSTDVGMREINWGCFLPVSEHERVRFLTDRNGVQHEEFLPPGSMRPDQEAQLRTRVGTLLPPFHFEIVAASTNTFAHGISTAAPQRYHRGRLCLVGDAGAVVQPFTTSGVFKGIRNALELVDALSEGADVEASLDSWDQQQRRTADGLRRLGEIMERALITRVPDFASMTQDALQAWWAETSRALDDAMLR